MPLPALLVFGPQTSVPDAKYLSQVREVLLLEPRLRFFVDAIETLADLWNVLVEEDARLQKTSGLDSINDLLRWIHGEDEYLHQGGQNTLTLPLTIIVHLTQYFYFLDNDVDYPSQRTILKSVEQRGIQGFCAGLLTAISVGCSQNEDDVNRFGAVALRLALCIGAYVDLDSVSNLQTVSLAVRWRSQTGRDRVCEILKGYSDAYTMVIVNECSVTVNVDKGHMAVLSQELSEEGMSVMPTGLEGRYHSPTNKDAVERILALCESQTDLSFPDAGDLEAPVRSNATAKVIQEGSLNRLALHSIMLELADWHRTISAATSDLSLLDDKLVMSLGATKTIPSSIAKQSDFKIVEGKSWNLVPRQAFGDKFMPLSLQGTKPPVSLNSPYGDNAIAVVGMACKFPGADSIEEFWQVLTTGTSMVAEMPADRFSTNGLRRTPDGKFRFFGNFVRDIAAFDHRFFKKSSREAASMDPQQRLILQCAYEALESSGHFGKQSHPDTDDTGCFVGVCTNDYNDNVASHNPNAYSSLGTLRAFISGKISHYFGWSGPSLTFDTACSSSAVAIHNACRSIQAGECSRAVAGGINLFTSPYFYENLVAASFLSATGQTKPFDSKADGYCRGEGAGLVVLKKLSTAIADGDTVMGVVSASGINQNSNAVGITVPHSPSQAALYTKALSLAGVDPKSVSYVEAHGTGTPVGDPREIASIREVFGGPARTDPLHVSSVKGNIGHLEAASGVASLIKTLLMMKYNTIPVQASFDSLNPAIPPLEPDRLIIPTSTHKWNARSKMAFINNYGASGSNATMIVCPPPSTISYSPYRFSENSSLSKYPIFISANSVASLTTNCAALHAQFMKLSAECESRGLLANLAQNLATKQNRALPHALATTAATLSELYDQFHAVANGSSAQVLQIPPKAKPVVLVFGGQVNDAVGLSKDLYEQSILFRSYLDRCDTILRSFGLKGLYPEIFQTTAVSDIVALQSMVFSLQYSCSKAWIDSGLEIEAVTGHSLGQYSAMCISGSLSLEEGLKLVSGRASLMQKHWGPESGSMVAIEADSATLRSLISAVKACSSDHAVEIACYNSPTSHVLVGREKTIARIQEIIADEPFRAKSIKSKRLNVTHGFHSVFTEHLLPRLTTLAEELAFKDPVIHLETCSDAQSWTRPNAQLVAEHTRTPVYFGQAINRLAARLGPCTWIEAGSASSVIGMARRALDPSVISQHSFQSCQLGSVGAMGSLADTTVNLWKWGHHVQFWPFHRVQKDQYTPINMPPYQFEKTRHWLDWKEPSGGTITTVAPTMPASEEDLISFVGYRGQNKNEAEFSVNPRSKQWKAHVSGHAVLAEPLFPAPMYVELASRAAMLLKEDGKSKSCPALIENIEIKSPLGLAQDRLITILMTGKETTLSWEFELTSRAIGEETPSLSHGTGTVIFQSEHIGLLADFARYEKLIGYDRFPSIRSDLKSEALQGAMVYSVFSKVVNYASWYKGVRSVFSRDGEAVGRVVPPSQIEEGLAGMITSPLALDSFLQVSGLHVNSLTVCGPNQVFVCTKLDRIQISPNFKSDISESREWDVYTTFTKTGDRTVSNDIYVFDSSNQRLVMIIFGAFFTRVPISSLAKVLSQANSTTLGTEKGHTVTKKPAQVTTITKKSHLVRSPPLAEPAVLRSGAGANNAIVMNDLRELIHGVADVSTEDLKDDSSLEELGIDSLMVTEIAGEIEKVFAVDIDPHDFETLQNLKAVGELILSRGYKSGDTKDNSSSSSSSGDSDEVSLSTPDTSPSTPAEQSTSQDVIEQLGKLLAIHLETTERMGRETNLAALGLDSLMCMELTADINKAFEIEIDMHLFNDESTFGDLYDLVILQLTTPEPAPVSIRAPAEPARGSKRVSVETVVYKQAGNLPLHADIYYPTEVTEKKRPVALLIHGGGHCLYTRKDVNSKQIKMLLSSGFLPVSVEYRLCPEVTLVEGPMTDVRDALRWAREKLPFTNLKCSGLKIDGGCVAAVGWSTGGTLAMSLGFTAHSHGIKPPVAILAFYSPTNYDDDCFKSPIHPTDAINSPDEEYDLLDSVRNEPFASYYPPLNKGLPGSFLMGVTDPRWRIILHMNWKAQMVPILINGLPSKDKLHGRSAESFTDMAMPSKGQIASISPYAQIELGNYQTPTFILHGTEDDLVPCQQSRNTIAALKKKGVDCGIGIASGARHLFDTFASDDPAGTGGAVVSEGYEFLIRHSRL